MKSELTEQTEVKTTTPTTPFAELENFEEISLRVSELLKREVVSETAMRRFNTWKQIVEETDPERVLKPAAMLWIAIKNDLDAFYRQRRSNETSTIPFISLHLKFEEDEIDILKKIVELLEEYYGISKLFANRR